MERELKALNDTQIEIQIPEDSQDGQELLDSWVPIREDKIEAGASPVVAPTGNVYAFFFFFFLRATFILQGFLMYNLNYNGLLLLCSSPVNAGIPLTQLHIKKFSWKAQPV